MKRRLLVWGLMLLAATAGGVLWLQAGPPALAPQTDAPASAAAAVQRGAYLAVLGHCDGCHTARGGAPMAGGRPIETPFGSVISVNLTPDRATGLGDWSAAAFRRALREGVARDGRRLTPTCPYPNFTLITDADADDLHAYLRSLAPQVQPRQTGSLRWPYGTQAALAFWQWRYLQPGPYQPNSRHDAAWNRGAYLAGGLGHCAACHGDAGTGDRAQGAPNLTDAIWLYGGDAATLTETVTKARYGVMPAWTGRLSEADIRAVAGYVHSLGGGE